MRLRISIRGRVRPPNMAIFEGEKSLTDVVNSNTMSDDEEVASDVPPRYLLDATTHLSIGRVCPSIRHSIGSSFLTVHYDPE